jgi:hypothetical protein
MVLPAIAQREGGREGSPAKTGTGSRLPTVAAMILISLSVLPSPCRGASCLTAETLFDLKEGAGIALRQPSDLSIHEEGLFVLDDLNGRVVKYSLAGDYVSSIPLPGGARASYLGLDLGGDDNLYLAASGSGKIVVISQSGDLVREFRTGEKDGHSEPVAVAVAPGSCFVVDNEEHKVKVFDLEGKALAEWGGRGEGRDTFRHPFRITRDELGRIIVSDSLNSRVKVFTPKGESLLDFGEFGVREGTLFRPAGIESWEGRVLVTDNYLGVVQLFDLQGEYQAVLCGRDGVPMAFENPVSLAADGPLVFVLEMGAGRVRALKIQPPQRGP